MPASAEERMKTGAETPTTYLDVHGLQRILAHGRMALEARVEAINALNVFPVPDGDTGINMFLTMKALEDGVASSRLRVVRAHARRPGRRRPARLTRQQRRHPGSVPARTRRRPGRQGSMGQP